jgi:D-alanyl-lipoteichoic acid acyltransferase DltB (MBOAT superfamily)
VGWKFLLVLLSYILIDFLLGLLLQSIHSSNQTIKLTVIGIAVAINLAPLLIYKYLGFFGEIVQNISQTQIAVPEIAVPIGISFLLFQAYLTFWIFFRAKFKLQRNQLILLCTFLSFKTHSGAYYTI